MVENDLVNNEVSTLEPSITTKECMSMSYNQKPNPFYIFLYINGHRLSNRIMYSRALENVIHFELAKSLELPLNQIFKKY